MTLEPTRKPHGKKGMGVFRTKCCHGPPKTSHKLLFFHILQVQTCIDLCMLYGDIHHTEINQFRGPSLPWSYGSWIFDYPCNQCLSPLMLWVRISTRVRCTILCDKVCQWLATGRWFSPGTTVSSTNKTDHYDTTETSNKSTNSISSRIIINKGTYMCISFIELP